MPLARLEQAVLADGGDRPARIVLYRRPLMARADGDEELAELVLDVIVEEFAHLLGVDPQTVDPSYPGDDLTGALSGRRRSARRGPAAAEPRSASWGQAEPTGAFRPR